MTEPPAALKLTEKSFLIEASAVARARRFAERLLVAEFGLDDEHVDAVVLVVSELTTNAIKYGAAGRRNIGVRFEIWPRWTLVIVDDRDATVRPRKVADPGELAESGRGLEIVQFLAARFWWRPLRFSKTANAVVLRTDVKLTADDEAILDRLQHGEQQETNP